ncbi:MAG: YaiI/YqxD family protein [Syntrophales bacterium]|jgi:hypothetical protein|nr:YaiI/YqxD family protein [Syntrophales bacterium]
MKVMVDADAFPSLLNDILLRAVQRAGVSLVFVSNKPLKFERSPIISCVVVPEGPDVADDRIVELIRSGDLAVTADIPLADRVIAKGARVISPRGDIYTEENIKDRLALRNLMNQLRDNGLITGGPKAFGKKDRQAFANQLNNLLSKYSQKAETRVFLP